MCPLFTNTDVSFADIGDLMQQFVRRHHMSEQPRRLLVGGMHAERILLSSDLLCWYINEGLIVDKIHQVIEYTPVRCFRSFVSDVAQARRKGDENDDMKIHADSIKLLGNAAYGSVIMDKQKHLNVKFYRDNWTTQQAINSPTFQSISEISDDLYEITSQKPKIRLDLPIQIGFQILQLAKLRMLQFFYNFLIVHCDREKFEMLEMDTDSTYFAIGGTFTDSTGELRPATSLEHILKTPETRLPTGQCNEDPHTPDEGHFLPRNCCQKHKKFDSRTPGLFKLEAEGEHMIGLCSKTYVLRHSDQIKISAKGLNKGRLQDPMQVFKAVLTHGESASAVNRGFRAKNNSIYTYEQERRAITYFYCKRRVLDDGIHTCPLSITLCPWPKRSMDIVTKGHALWPDRERIFDLSFGLFHSLYSVCAHSFSQSNRDDLVREALKTLDYEPKGELVFVNEGNFGKWENRKIANLWTSGTNARCAVLIPSTKYQGLNLLAELFLET